ncbi:hypothetical protein [Hymenobacter sp. BT190]|uniref:hypothetical protein n=1 Tax=Hymenobacter sp. BT190 TaxID=2763505 RepID=UPI0016510410|nr:hypothetical protein [Hymenobacter sp. BT190]MBC6700103.1 hypothetical protein [Hymenobacter sp. BT190]
MKSQLNIDNYNSIKGYLLNSKALQKDISAIKRRIRLDQVPEIVKFIYSVKKINANIYDPFPSNVSLLTVSAPLATVDLEKELLWTASYLKCHYQKLNIFINLSESFNKHILHGNYDECEHILNEIEQHFGYSYWYIKNKIAFLQASKGLEPQKSFSAYVRLKSNRNSATYLFAHYISYRNEPSTSYFAHRKYVEDILQKNIRDSLLHPFFKYHFAANHILGAADLSILLNVSNSVSVIDSYEALMYAVKSIIASFNSNLSLDIPYELKSKTLPNLLSDLASVVKSSALDILNNKLFEDKQQLLPSQIAYIHNQFDLAINFAKSEFYENANNIGSLVTVSRILERPNAPVDLINSIFPKKGIALEIIKRLSSLLKVDDDFENSLIYLLNLTVNYYTYAWADGLLGYIVNIISNETTDEDIYLAHYGATALQTEDLYRFWFFLKPKSKKDFYNNIANNKFINIQNSLDTLLRQKNDQTSQVDINELTFANTLKSFVSNKNSIGLTLCHRLLESEDGFIKYSAMRMYCQLLLRSKKFDECIDFVVTKYIDNNRVLAFLPIEKIVKELEAIKFTTSDPLSQSILLDIYKLISDNRLERRKKYAYEDFLKSNGVKRASELNDSLDEYPINKIIYFLKEICNENMFSKSIAFRSSQEVVRERLLVCKLLIQCDPSNTEVYQNEIKDIQRKIMIRKRVKEIEKSKIYVNSNQLKLVVSKQIKDKFARYISLIKEGIDSEYFANIETKMRDTYSKLPKDLDGASFSESILSLDLPENETYALFESMIVDLRDLFVSNTEYGLDGYLSTRIRHGTLSSQTRSVLELNNLITQRVKSTNGFVYQNNDYWPNELSINDSVVILQMEKTLSEFSQTFDSLLEKILGEWVQIKKGPDDKGMFNFSLGKQGMIILSSEVTANTSFDDFLEAIFKQFYLVLEDALDKFRERISSEIKPSINDMFDHLLKQVNSISNIPNIAVLNTAISRTRSEVQVAIDRVTEWFRLSKEFANEPFTVDDSINISIDSITTLYPDFKANLDVAEEVTCLFVNGQYLANYVDIFFIIFENIIKHSGYYGQSKADIFIFIKNNNIVVNIENAIASLELSIKSKRKLNQIKDYIDKNISQEYVNLEGGSGFFKIQKILQYDIADDINNGIPYFSFGADSQKFFVQINFPFDSKQFVKHEDIDR